MYVNKDSLNLFMAEKCLNPYDVCKLASISYETFRKIRNGKKAKPATIGKIAVALSVPVEKLVNESGDLVSEDDEERVYTHEEVMTIIHGVIRDVRNGYDDLIPEDYV